MNTLFLRNMTVVLLLALAGWRMWGPGVQADKLAVPGVEQVRLTDAVPQQVREGNSSEERFSLRRIEDVRAGDLVYARDAETGKTSLRRVVQTFKRMADHLQIVELRNPDGSIARIETTDEHPFFVKSARASDTLGRDRSIDSHRTEGAETLATATWHQVAAKNLRPGDQIESLTGQYATVVSNTYQPHPEGIPVYNFEVQQDHTYFVLDHTARGPPIWVHNNCWEVEIIANKKVNVGDKVSFDQAVEVIEDGGDIMTDNYGEAKRLAEATGDGPPVWHDPKATDDGYLREGHFHPRGPEGDPRPNHIIPRVRRR